MLRFGRQTFINRDCYHKSRNLISKIESNDAVLSEFLLDKSQGGYLSETGCNQIKSESRVDTKLKIYNLK